MAKANYDTGYTGGMKKGKAMPVGKHASTNAKVTTNHSKKKGTQKGHLK